MFVTCSTFPIVNNRQRTKAKSIIELLIVAMIMLCGALVRTFFTSSPARALESVQHIAHKWESLLIWSTPSKPKLCQLLGNTSLDAIPYLTQRKLPLIIQGPS